MPRSDYVLGYFLASTRAATCDFHAELLLEVRGGLGGIAFLWDAGRDGVDSNQGLPQDGQGQTAESRRLKLVQTDLAQRHFERAVHGSMHASRAMAGVF